MFLLLCFLLVVLYSDKHTNTHTHRLRVHKGAFISELSPCCGTDQRAATAERSGLSSNLEVLRCVGACVFLFRPPLSPRRTSTHAVRGPISRREGDQPYTPPKKKKIRQTRRVAGAVVSAAVQSPRPVVSPRLCDLSAVTLRKPTSGRAEVSNAPSPIKTTPVFSVYLTHLLPPPHRLATLCGGRRALRRPRLLAAPSPAASRR